MADLLVKHQAGTGTDGRAPYTATYVQADGRRVQAEFHWDAQQQRMVCHSARRAETSMVPV